MSGPMGKKSSRYTVTRWNDDGKHVGEDNAGEPEGRNSFGIINVLSANEEHNKLKGITVADKLILEIQRTFDF